MSGLIQIFVDLFNNQLNDAYKSVLSGFAALFVNIIGSYSSMTSAISSINISTAINSVAISLTSLFFVLEAFSQMSQFRFERIEDAIRLGIKFIVMKIIVENTDTIIDGIYGIMSKPYNNTAINTSLNAMADELANAINLNITATGIAGAVVSIFAFLLGALSVIVLVILMFIITIQIVGVVFEMVIMSTLGPIALSTLCNDLARSTGIGFIKNFAACVLQLTTIIICFAAFSVVIPIASNASLLGGSVAAWITALISPILCMVCLSTAISKSGDITRRIVGS